MKEWIPFDALRFWGIIAVGSLIGLLGAYGREQHEGRKTDRKWLGLRLCVMPFLALAAAAAADAFNLSPQVAAFVSSIFSMLAFDLVRVIALRTLKKVGGDIMKLPSDAAVELPAGPGKPEVVTVQVSPSPPMRNELRRAVPLAPERDPKIETLLEKLGDADL